MKLRNKLIPIMTIATASTVVAPIASSCSFSMDNIVSDVKDITSPFTPDIAKAEKQGTSSSPVDPDKVMDIYMNHVMANPEILKQDIWYYESKMLPYRIELIEHTYVDIDGDYDYDESEKYNSVTNVVANINISDVEVKRQEGIIKAKKTEFYTVSMNIGYELSYTATSLATDPRVQLENKVSFQTQYKNVPLFMYNYNGGYEIVDRDYCWFSCDLLSTNIDEYLNEIDGGWSFAYDISQEYNYNITSSQGLTQTYGDKNSAKDTLTRRSQVEKLSKETDSFAFEFLYDGHIDFPSYHMSDVTPGEVQTFKLVGNTETTTAKVKLSKDAYGDWITTPDENSFHILQLTDRNQGIWDTLGNVSIRLSGGYTKAKTKDAQHKDPYRPFTPVFVGEDLYMNAPDNDYTIDSLNIDSETYLVKSNTDNILDVSSVADNALYMYYNTLAPETGTTFKLKFTIPSGIYYTTAYTYYDEKEQYLYSDTDVGYVYDDIDYWVEFTVA